MLLNKCYYDFRSSLLFGTLSDIVYYSDYYPSHCVHDEYYDNIRDYH